MRFSECIKNIAGAEILGNPEIEAKSLHFDSRKVAEGTVFVAQRGVHADGHQYIATAIEKGAVAIVCEDLPEELLDNVCYVKVKDSDEALGEMAAAFYGRPSEKLKVVGVTGTNGKTSIASLLFDLFRGLGYKAGLLSTILYRVNDKIETATHTTPDALRIQKLLSDMVEDGCEYCFMEVSSHSIHQKRVDGIHFSGGIFTNITHDHLDYHKTFSEYIRVKKAFFDQLPADAFALSNLDDKNGLVMLQNTRAVKRTYSLRSMADFHAKVLESHFDGMLMNIDGQEIWTRFVGGFNASNLLAVYGAAIELGQDKTEVLQEMSKLIPVKGRFETLRSDDGRLAIVDYAHTPDALKNVLETITGIRKGTEQVITVVGAGGDRDKTKRPEMTREALRGSDKVILTSDNPRTEDPAAIIADMETGIERKNRHKVLSIENRREAIKTAAMLAQAGDIILIAGKGHENYQEVNGVKHHFDDMEEIRNCFGLKEKEN